MTTKERLRLITLGIDTSANMISVALAQDKQLLGETFAHAAQKHSETLLCLIDNLLKTCGLAFKDIGRIVATQGPGSFTGLRIGVATAKGLAMARGLPCAGVSTLKAMAAGAQMLDGTLCCVMDARREQVYAAMFAGRTRLCEDQAISIVELEKKLAGKTWLLGDGAQLCYDKMAKRDDLLLAPEQLRYQKAFGAILASEEDDYAPAAKLRVTYLRPSQAEREREEKRNETT